MTNLGIAGGISLRNINQWISVIDTNLTNSKRIGYKETSVSMTSGEVGRYGTTQSIGKIQDITFPSASLEIGKTRILDSVQGNLTQTGQVTDFALNGTGYFVVEDKLGNRYATRDGQFNFDTEGYLVTQEGLRVLTTGFDYVRVPSSENFAVNTEGQSQSIVTGNTIIDGRFNPTAGVSSLSQSVYGTRKLLVVDIIDDYKLIYSKYGYTKFDLGKRVPIVVRNDFSEYADGIGTYLVSDNLNGVPNTTMASFFKQDIQNGTLKMATRDINGIVRYVQAGYGGQKYMEFQTQMDFHIRTDDSANKLTGNFSSFGITFGKSTYDTMDNDVNTFFAGIVNNKFVLTKGGVDIGTSPVNLGGTLDTDDPDLAFFNSPSRKFTIKLAVADGQMVAQLLQNGANVGTITVSGYGAYQGGYMSVGTSRQDANLNSGSLAQLKNDSIDITDITIIERNQDSNFSQNVVQKNVKDIWKDGSNAQIKETQVMQQYLEESTSTIADTLPLLSNTQKLFSAVSKIISVYNSITDDMNNTVR